MMQLDIQEFGTERARQAFVRLAKNVKDMSEVWKLYRGFHISDLVPLTFASRGAAMGQRWAKYSPAYLAKRRKAGFSGGQMLVLRGDLKAVATGGSGFTSRIEKQQLTMAISGLPYIRVHQFGYQPKNIPARPYFFNQKNDLPARAWAFMIRATDDHLLKGVEN